MVDVIGQIGFDPGSRWGSEMVSTAGHTLRRRAQVCGGDLDGFDVFDPGWGWDAYPVDTFGDLGFYTAACQTARQFEGGEQLLLTEVVVAPPTETPVPSEAPAS